MHEAMMVCSALSTGWHDVDIDVDTNSTRTVVAVGLSPLQSTSR